MNQLDLNGGEREIGTPELTERQQAVYQLARRHAEGITADEAGALLHELAGRHSADARCEWDARNGRGVLEALVRKNLLRRRRGGERGLGYLYVVADATQAEDTRAWSISDEIPF